MDLAGSAQYAARAVESKPDDLPALQLLASADVKLAKWQEAKHAFERVLTSSPTMWTRCSALANANWN